MEGVESTYIGETPHASIDSSGSSRYDSVDSGYMTLTPHSSYSSTVSSCKIRSSGKWHRSRPDPWQREKHQRQRSKFNQLLNVSEPDYLISTSAEQRHSSVLEEASRGNTGLVHSTPSCADDGFDEDSHRSRNRRNWRTTVPITPASTDLQLLSPPPSPAVPTPSYVASVPIREDVEMQLVVTSPKIARRIATSSTLEIVPRIAHSPVRGPAVTSVENRRLSELSIADLGAVPEIKPKRLDFSLRSWSAGPRHSDVRLGYAGRDKVDFLSLLGEKSNNLELVSKILSCLGAQDLCSVSLVSTVWRRLCENDVCANRKRIDYIVCRQNIKENLKATRKMKHEQNIQSSPKSRYCRKGYLLDVQNLLNIPLQAKQPSSPPVSPSKIKFNSFVKVSRSIHASRRYLKYYCEITYRYFVSEIVSGDSFIRFVRDIRAISHDAHSRISYDEETLFSSQAR